MATTNPIRKGEPGDCRLVPRKEPTRGQDHLIVLQTGARKGGIGHATARALARKGHTVIVAERDREAGRAAVRDLRAESGDVWFAHLDASDEERVERLMDLINRRFGRLDAVVNNAGYAGPNPDNFLDQSAHGFRELLDANLVSAFVMTRAALRRFFLRQPTGGTCVYLGSTNGQPGNGTQLAYAAAKTALSALVRVGATQFGRHCRFLLVRPGLVETDSHNWEVRRQRDPEYPRKEGQKIALGRLARPDEVAAVIAFLLTPEAAYIQGAEINLDGGLMATGVLLPGGASMDRDAYVALVDLIQQTAAPRAA